jgi:hypothetical protein
VKRRALLGDTATAWLLAASAQQQSSAVRKVDFLSDESHSFGSISFDVIAETPRDTCRGGFLN